MPCWRFLFSFFAVSLQENCYLCREKRKFGEKYGVN